MNIRARRFLILFGVMAAVAVVAGAAWLFREASIAKNMRESREAGLSAYEAGDYNDETLKKLSYVAARDKDDGDVLYALADTRRRVRMENGRHIVSAIAFARASKDALPDDPRPLELLLELYALTQFVTETLDTANELLEIDGNHSLALQSKVRALQAKGNLDEALDAAKRLATAHPEAISSHMFVLNLMRLKNAPVEERVAYAERLATDRPNDVDALLLLARIVGSARDFERASELVRRVAGMPLTKAQSLAELTRLMDLLRMSDEAVAMLERQSTNPTLADAATLLAAERGWKAGLMEEAHRALGRLLVDLKKATDGALGLAALLAQSGYASELPTGADAELRTRTTAEAVAWQSLLDARAALFRGDIDQASPLLDRALDQQFAVDIALFTRGQLELARLEPARAAATLEEAIRIEPRWMELRLLLVSTLADMGKLESAVEEAQRCAAVFPRRLEPYNAVARVTTMLVESGRASPQQVDTMLDLLDKLGQEKVNQAAIVSMKARVLAAAGRTKEAGDTLAKALADGVQPGAGSLGEWLRVAQDVQREDVLTALQALADAAPLTPGLALNRAMAAAKEGRIVEGATLLRDAAKAASEGDRLNYERALAVYLDQNGEAEALAIRQRLAKENPTSLLLQNDLIYTESAWADHDVIREALARIKQVAGTDSVIWKVTEARRLLTFERTQANAAAAAALLNDVLRVEPENLRALLLLGESNIALDDMRAAVTLFSKALDSAPREAGLYPRVVRMLQETGASAEAERRLRDFAALTDVPIEVRRQRAQLLVFQAMWPEAEADLREIVKTGQARDRLALAEFLTIRGRATEAAPLYEALANEQDAEPTVYLAAADFFAERGDSAKATALMERACEKLPNTSAQVVRARFKERQGLTAEAEQMFTDAAEKGSPSDAALWAELVAFHIRHGEEAKANAAVERALKAHPGDETLERVSRMLAQAAGGDSTDGVGLEPQQLELLEAQKSRPTDAAQAAAYLTKLDAITQKYPTYLNGWGYLVGEALAFGDRALAVSAAQRAARALPSDPRAAQLATETLAEVGQLTEAIAMAKAWRDRSLRDPMDAELALAGMEMMAGRPAEALALLDRHRDRLLEQAIQRIDLISLYGSLLSGSGRMDDARKLLTIESLGSDGKAQVYLAIGRGLYGAKAADARAWLEGASVAMDLTNPRHTLALGEAWFEFAAGGGGGSQDYGVAITILQPLLSDPDRRVAAAGLLATACDQVGRFDEAEVAYKVVLDANPSQPIILNNLAYMLLKRDKNAAGAEPVRLAESAVRLAKEQGMAPGMAANLMDTLGAALLAAGRADDAARAFRDGLGLDPDNPDLVAGLAHSLCESDNVEAIEEAKSSVARFERLARTKRISASANERIVEAKKALATSASGK